MEMLTALAARLAYDDEGQDLVEYALLSAFVALVIMAGATLLGISLNNWYASAGANVNTHAASAS
jgi:Flp pilus assembly pilin Flp